jgi:uncharacterized protein YjbI with pentapeptide repeats/5-hydroxyisourate hydrolase-like protein (transthyretin family)
MLSSVRAPRVVGLIVAAVGACALLTGCQPAAVTLDGQLNVTGGVSSPAGIQVAVYSNTSNTSVATTVTDSAGRYSFDATAVPAGTYRVRFSDSDWWQGANSWSGGSPVVLSTSATTTINEALTPATGSVTGTVTDGTNPLNGTFVTALSTVSRGFVASTVTAGGNYTLSNLPTGTYRIQFQASGYTTRYSNSTPTPSTAPIVTVTANTATAGVNTVLAPQSTISGTILGMRGGSNITVAAYSASTGDLIESVSPNAGGYFKLSNLDSIGYKLLVSDTSGRMRSVAWGSTTSVIASGTTFTPAAASDLAVGSLAVVGRDCDPAIFTPGANLAGANLSTRVLDNCNFHNDDLTGTNLAGAELTGASSGGIVGVPAALPAGWSLHGGYLVGPFANLAGADLSGVDLTGVDLRNADLTGANLTGATLTSADLTGTTLTRTTLTGVRSGGIAGTPTALPSPYQLIDGYVMGPGVDLSSANLLGGVQMENIDFTGAKFNGAHMAGDSLQGDVLTGVDLTGTDLSGAFLYQVRSGGIIGSNGAKLPANYFVDRGFLVGQAVDLSGENLGGVYWNQANLEGVNFSNAVLPGCILTSADIRNTNLTNADLTGCDLTSAQLTGATISGTKFAGATLANITTQGLLGSPVSLPTNWTVLAGYLAGPGANLAHGGFNGQDLSGLNLTSANLTGANLNSAILTGTKLSGATLQGVVSGGITGTPAALPFKWSIVNGYLMGPGADLRDAHLYLANLSGVDLTGALLDRIASGAISNGPAALPPGWTFTVGYLVGPTANLANANLTNAHLSSATLTAARLSGATLTGADLSYVVSGSIIGTPTALPTGWTLRSGYLLGPKANLSGAILTLQSFGQFNFSGMNLSGADLHNDFMVQANFTGTELQGANLSGSSFAGANLTGADLYNANIGGVTSGGITGTPAALPVGWSLINGYLVGPGADLTSANLAHADLRGINLMQTAFASANLTGTNFSGDYLEVAKFDYSNVTNADFTGADITNSSFANATITGTNFSGSTVVGLWSGGLVGTPASLPTGVSIIHGYLFGGGTMTRFADFSGADLTGVSFAGYSLVDINFAGATGSPSGGSTAFFFNVTCPDLTVANYPDTCVGHGFAP